MTMKMIKKTDEFSIFLRGDERYAVKDAAGKAVNGDEKTSILLDEGLIQVSAPSTPAEPAAAEPEAEAEAEAEGAAESAEAESAEAEDGDAE